MNASLVRSIVASCAVALAVGWSSSGCSSSRRVLFGDSGDEAIAANSPTIVALAAGDLALQASLALMDPANHQVITPRPNVSAGANDVTLDFGDSSETGNEVAEVDLRDDVAATFNRNGATGTVNVSFPTLVARTDHLGTVDVFGSTIYTCNFAGATCSGTITLNVTTDGPDLSTVTGTLNYTITNGIISHSGGPLTTDTVRRGDWTSSFSNVELNMFPSAGRVISSGSIALTRTSGSTLGVSLLFTRPNGGTLTVTPGGSTRSFDL